MPVLPDRDDHEERIAKAMRRANAVQRAKLLDALGDPPDMSRVPETLWLEIEREQASSLWRPLAITGLTGAAVLAALMREITRQEIDAEQLALTVETWAMRRAEWVAQRYTRHTRERLSKAFATATEPEAGEILHPVARAPSNREARDILAEILTDERADGVGTTETTHAQTGGERATRDRIPLDIPDPPRLLAIWRHRKAIVKGKHPCPLCAPLVGLDETEWAAVNPAAVHGPPLHPNCDCNVEHMAISGEESRRLPSTPPRNWDQGYDEHFDRIATSRRPVEA